MHGLRAGAPRREFEQFVTDSADQLLRTVYLMVSGGVAESPAGQRPRWLELGEVVEALVVGVGGVGEVGGF
jgi:hypothetical protein